MTEIVKESTGMNPKIKERIEQIHQGIVPEGYKKTRIGIIPEEWECKRLAKILKVKHGKSQKGIENNHGKYPILATSGVIGKTDQYLYNKESVLIGRKGTINRPYYMNSPFWTIDTLFYTEINESHCAKFIYYKFCNINWLKYNEASGVPSLSSGTIESIFVSLPRKKEQQQIAEILSTWDRAIELKEALIKEKEEQKKGLMQYLLEKRLLNHKKVKLKDLVYEPDQPRVEEPWNIELLTVSLHNKGIKKSGKFPNKTQKGRPYYKRYKGELLIGRQNFHNGGIGFVLEEHDSLICSNAITSLLPKEGIDMYYVYYYLSNPNYYRRIESIIGGTGQKEISKKELMNLRIKAAPLKEQNKISSILFTKDKQINLLKQELSLLKEQKKGLMQLLLTGIVRVGEVEELE